MPRAAHAVKAPPPASSDQVLHAKNRHEPFLALDLRPLAAVLPSRALQGREGDRYLVADCDSRSEFLWITAWDSGRDAREVEAPYATIAEAAAERAALSAPPRMTRLHR